MQNNPGSKLMLSGLLVMIISFLAMNASDIGTGFVIAPLLYLIGPGLLLAGIIKGFTDSSSKHQKIRNFLVVGGAVMIVGSIIAIVNTRINDQQNRQQLCEQKYGYLTADYSICIGD